jgi:acetyl esterase
MAISELTSARNAVPLAGYPAALREMMSEVGPIWGQDMPKHRDRVMAAFGALLKEAPRVPALRDLAYGPHPRHVFDLYRPTRPAAAAPILIFVHGGAFIRGNKDAPSGVYGNVPSWFARQGYVAITLEYRLAPEAPFPGGADDVARAVAWIAGHADEFGGDPRRIFLLGHSAGGTHVASYVFDPALGYLGHGVRGIVLASARLRADVLPINPNANGVRAYFGEDASLYEVRSPITHAAESPMPIFIAVAEYDNPLLDVYGAELFYRMSVARGRTPGFFRLTGHNHTSTMAHFDTGEEILGGEILAFFDSVG